MKFLILFYTLLFLLFPTSSLRAEENIISVNAAPFVSIPMGSSSDLFKSGFGVRGEFSFIPSRWKSLGLGISAEYFDLSIRSSDSIWIASALAGPVFLTALGKNRRFNLFAGGGAGYYYSDSMGWDSQGYNEGGLVYGGNLGLSVVVKGPLSLGLGSSYFFYNNLYNAVNLSLYARLDFGRPPVQKAYRVYSTEDEVRPDPMQEGEGLEFDDLELISLFPVLYKYYDSNPIGSIRIKNTESETARDIKIQFYMERYMDNPMESGDIFNLEPGEEKTVLLYGLFTEDMMEITEGSKASARLTVSYSIAGYKGSYEYNPVMELNNRNALTWDDDRKIASFITAKDPEILSFSKKVSNWMQEIENPALDENLQKGMILFEAVQSYGIRYEVDPATPFATLSQQKSTVDFIQFPRQTLAYTTGDCDDLTALYASMLESVGVETGIITIPGHIYMAFALKKNAEEIRAGSSRRDEFLYFEDKAWVPVEITMFQESFEKAWQEGAKEWRENDTAGQAAFYSTREAWLKYQAVGFKETSSGIDMPGQKEVTENFERTVKRYVEQEIYPQESQILERMAESARPYIYENKLAVLYARYGLYDRALEKLLAITASREFLPAILNTGNIFFLREDYKEALKRYEEVLTIDSKNKKALLGSARCNHELENYGLVKTSYKDLQSVDSNLARQYSYLDLRGTEGQRASDAMGLKDTVLWEDEE